MKKFYLTLLPTLLWVFVLAQTVENLPTDYLTKEFHAGRREALRALMPSNSVAVITAYPERVFSSDVNYKYHQNPDLYYFSGYNEPNALLFIFKDQQTNADNKKYNELFFVQKRDSSEEIWTGKRMGTEKVKLQLGFDMVLNGADFKSFPINFSAFNKIFYRNLSSTAEDHLYDTTDLYDLIKGFKKKVGVNEFRDENNHDYLTSLSSYATIANYIFLKTSSFDKWQQAVLQKIVYCQTILKCRTFLT